MTAGVVAADGASQEETFAEVVVGDIAVGEDEQRFGPMRAVGLDDDVEEVVVEINVTVLETHGVDIGHAEVDLTDDVQGASVVSTSVEDGVVTLVFAPDASVIRVESFQVTGLDTGDAEAASDLTFDVTFSEGDADGRGFDIVDPDEATPTAAPDTLYSGFGEHRVTVSGIQPTDGNVTVELDTTVLEAHGITVDDLEAEVESAAATVRETTVEDGIVTVILAPADDTVLFDARIHLSEFGTTADDTDEQGATANVTYEASIEGDAADGVDVETFGLVSGYPSPHHTEATSTERDTAQQEDVEATAESTRQEDGTATISEGGPGFGLVIALVAAVGSALLGARRT